MQPLRQAEELIGKYVKQQQRLRDLNAFVHIVRPRISQSSSEATLLNGALIGIKDNICTSKGLTTCGSVGLREHVSPYEATVVTKICEAGGTVAGKTNLDEFGMGSHSTYTAFGTVRTLEGHSAGGSSGGSAVAVATGQCESALGTDTGGSVRLPAAYIGIYGFKPSYGLISRWGVVAYANSLDTVGFLARSTDGVRKLFAACTGYDSKDPTSLPEKTRIRMRLATTKKKMNERKLRVGVPYELITQSLSPAVKHVWSITLRRLAEAGHTIHSVSLPSTTKALSAYYVIAPAEASSNLAKYDSVRYGSPPPSVLRDDPQQRHADAPLYVQARHHGFGAEVRRRILLGVYSLSAAAIDNYFLQAQRVRRCLQREFDNVFAVPNPLRESDQPTAETRAELETGVDVIICPTAPTLPPKLDDVAAQNSIDSYSADVLTVPASLAGLPAINVPVERDAKDRSADRQEIVTVGIQIIGQFGSDDLVLNVAEAMEGQNS